MEQDDQRTFGERNGNAVVSAVGLWAARDGIHLRIDTAGVDAQATVTNGPRSVRDHRILFRDLRRVLMAEGCWQMSDEGAEARESGNE